MVNERRIAVLGAGKIGEALIGGLLSSGWREPADITASSRRPERVTELGERYGVSATLSNEEAVAGAALVVIAVKPQDIEILLGEIGHLISTEQTVLSVAAAIPTATIERHLAPGVPVDACDAEHAVGRPRGCCGALRRRPRRRRATSRSPRRRSPTSEQSCACRRS